MSCLPVGGCLTNESRWLASICAATTRHQHACRPPANNPLPAPCSPLRSGFADSKTLQEEKRERLYGVIQAEMGLLGYEADVLSARFISGAWMEAWQRALLTACAFLK